MMVLSFGCPEWNQHSHEWCTVSDDIPNCWTQVELHELLTTKCIMLLCNSLNKDVDWKQSWRRVAIGIKWSQRWRRPSMIYWTIPQVSDIEHERDGFGITSRHITFRCILPLGAKAWGSRNKRSDGHVPMQQGRTFRTDHDSDTATVPVVNTILRGRAH
jgi:hypothetical protein